MVAEDWAWGVLKKALKLTDEDIKELREGLLSFKDMGPAYLKRAEATEKRVLAISYFLKNQNVDLWERCEQMAQHYFTRQALVDEKTKSKSATVEKL